MDSTHTVTVQVTITYDGIETPWSSLIEEAVEDIAEEVSVVVAEVLVERID